MIRHFLHARFDRFGWFSIWFGDFSCYCARYNGFFTWFGCFWWFFWFTNNCWTSSRYNTSRCENFYGRWCNCWQCTFGPFCRHWHSSCNYCGRYYFDGCRNCGLTKLFPSTWNRIVQMTIQLISKDECEWVGIIELTILGDHIFDVTFGFLRDGRWKD